MYEATDEEICAELDRLRPGEGVRILREDGHVYITLANDPRRIGITQWAKSYRRAWTPEWVDQGVRVVGGE